MGERHYSPIPLETLQAIYLTTLRNKRMQMFVSGSRNPLLTQRVCTALLIMKF